MSNGASRGPAHTRVHRGSKIRARDDRRRLGSAPYPVVPRESDFLRNIEGHYTRGVRDGKNSPDTPLEMLPGAVEEARNFLASRPETLARLDRVSALIEGFETPFGMELLGTVHWVMQHGANPDDVDDVVAKVHGWSDRKRSQMKDGHVRARGRDYMNKVGRDLGPPARVTADGLT